MKFGVLVFPGSNCDHDTHHVVDAIAHQPVTYLWHASEDLQGCDAILVPGGFAYGDYLRTGAIAKFAPVMQSVAKFAKGGGSYASTNDPRMVFGLGSDQKIDKVTVFWPSGKSLEITGLETDGYWQVVEGETKAKKKESPKEKGQ